MNESLPILVKDLAYILIVAGITTVLFKKLRQPLVLGYIVAGFLAGPYMPYTRTIIDTEMVNDWGQIGVIILMFSLGLEFSFKKIIKMGINPILCACMIMTGMMCTGNLIGYIFGWGGMDSLFLGGMLAMSSTTIIYKAYEDFGITHKHFAGNVLSVLVLEDILGILLIVVLSTIAATRNFEGQTLALSLLTLGSVLMIWFLVGVFILPLVLKKYGRYMNQETLMIVSLALCFLLVILSDNAGYSSAFGAFMMGSILAETVQAENINIAISPVKNLFGAVFFVSVGMMVNPGIIIEYWPVILVIVASIVLAQSLLGTLSYLLTGSNLRDSIHSGFSMAQIGEFAFIIAGIGQSLHVTSPKLYPIVVAVSIITTFLTPYMIRYASPVSDLIIKHLGEMDKLSLRIGHNPLAGRQTYIIWKSLLTSLLYQTVSYLVLSYTFVGISYMAIRPILSEITDHFNRSSWCDRFIDITTATITIIIISPFLRAVCMRKNRSAEVKYLKKTSLTNKILVYLTIVVRYILCTILIYTIIDNISPLDIWVNIFISILIVGVILSSRLVKLVSIRIERIFKQNLHQRDNINKSPRYARQLRGKDLHLAKLTIPEYSTWAGLTLSTLSIGHDSRVHIAAIRRGHLRYNIPGGNSRLFPGDIIEVVGDDEGIEVLKQRIIDEVNTPEDIPQPEPLTIKAYTISPQSKYSGLKLSESKIREQYHCTVIGQEDSQGNLSPMQADTIIKPDSRIWIVGEEDNLSEFDKSCLGC